MARHVFAQSPEAQAAPTRRQVSLVRRDLLLLAEAVDPRTGETVDLPIPSGGPDGGCGALVGPSVALSLVRRVVAMEGLAAPLREQAKARAGGVLPQYVAVWTSWTSRTCGARASCRRRESPHWASRRSLSIRSGASWTTYGRYLEGVLSAPPPEEGEDGSTGNQS